MSATNPTPNQATSVTNDIAIALALVDTVMRSLPQTAPFEPLVAMLGAAAVKLAANIGTDVTFNQLEGLRVHV